MLTKGSRNVFICSIARGKITTCAITTKKPKDIADIEDHYALTIDNLATFEALEVRSAEQQTSELQAYSRFADRITLVIYLFAILLTVSLGFLLIRIYDPLVTHAATRY